VLQEHQETNARLRARSKLPKSFSVAHDRWALALSNLPPSRRVRLRSPNSKDIFTVVVLSTFALTTAGMILHRPPPLAHISRIIKILQLLRPAISCQSRAFVSWCSCNTFTPSLVCKKSDYKFQSSQLIYSNLLFEDSNMLSSTIFSIPL